MQSINFVSITTIPATNKRQNCN